MHAIFINSENRILILTDENLILLMKRVLKEVRNILYHQVLASTI